MNKYRFIFLVPIFILACGRNLNRTNEKAQLLLEEIANGTATNEFSEKYFPKDQTIKLMEQLQNYCDFKNRRGRFINDFYQKSIGEPDQVTFIYEYYLKCDSIRFLITYRLGENTELIKFALESIKKDNPMILKPELRLWRN